MVNYTDYECGGSIDLNDVREYPPCKNFNDGGERSRQILKNENNIYKNTQLIFYIVKHDKPIQDLKYIGVVDYFEEIKLIIIDNAINKNILNYTNETYHIEVDGTILTKNNIKFSSNYKREDNKNQTIEFSSGFKFINFNNELFIFTVNSTSSSIYINNCIFQNTPYIFAFYDNNPDDINWFQLESITFNNCIFKNFKDSWSYFAIRHVLLINCKFIEYYNLKNIIQGNPINFKAINCTFQNNYQTNNGTVLLLRNKKGTIKVHNCKFINNTIVNFLTVGDESFSTTPDITISNSTFINNTFKHINPIDNESCYFITFYSMDHGYKINFKDTVIERPINNELPGGFIHSSRGSGQFIFDNFKITNYKFDSFMNVSNSVITFINTPQYKIITGTNNTIVANNNKIYIQIIVIPTVICFSGISVVIVMIILIKKNIIEFTNFKKDKNNKQDKSKSNNKQSSDFINYGSTDNITTISDSLSNTYNDDKCSAIVDD